MALRDIFSIILAVIISCPPIIELGKITYSLVFFIDTQTIIAQLPSDCENIAIKLNR
jgi:hypothetical protein